MTVELELCPGQLKHDDITIDETDNEFGQESNDEWSA